MNGKRLVTLAVGALLAVPLGCTSDSPKNQEQTEEQVRSESEDRTNDRDEDESKEAGREQTDDEPELTEHELLEKTNIQGLDDTSDKVRLRVRLKSRVDSEEQLEALGKHLRKKEAPDVERFIVHFALPGEEPGPGSYATWDPQKKSQFTVSVEETREEYLKRKRAREKANANRQVLGQWSGWNHDERLIIYRKDGSHYLEERTDAEAVKTIELNLEKEGPKKVLRTVDGDTGCDRFTILSDGELRCYFKEPEARPKRKMKASKRGANYHSFSPLDEYGRTW